MTALVTVQNIAKSFGNRVVLDGVSFAVHSGDRIALVGLNGAGKSTLLRLLVAGADATAADLPDAGLITRRRNLSVEYVPQEPPLDANRTVGDTLRDGLRAHQARLAALATLEEQLASGTLAGNRLDQALAAQAALHEAIAHHGGWDRDHEIRGLAASLSLPPQDARVGDLSGGERRRIALARALLARPELLALDEPTNHLDTGTIEWLEQRLLEHPGALLLVTHDRYFLDRVATRILELDRGKLYAYDGSYTRFLEKQAERLATESAREQARAAFVRRELDWIRRGPKARGTKQKARIDRFEGAVAARPTAAQQRPGELELRLGTGGRLGKTILELRGVSKTLGGRRLVEDLTLLLKPGDRIGVVGPNGAGKTTLVRILVGQLPPDAGEVVVGHNTRLAFLDQMRAELNDARTVLEEVAGEGTHVFLESGSVHVRTFLRMMLFDDQFADTPVAALSGGERNRVQLAKLLRTSGNLLVLDEPTNDLDVMTLGVLEDALAHFAGCAIIVSHDRWFLDKVATGILAFEGDGRVVFYEGDYSAYMARRVAAPSSRPAAPPTSPARPAVAVADSVRPGPRKLSFKEQQELAGMEAAILTAEDEVTTLQSRLNDPTLYKQAPTEIPGLIAALDAARARVEHLYARWQELSDRA